MGNNINSTPRLQIQKYYPNKRDQEGNSNWQDGELVHANQMNHIENGLAEVSKLDLTPEDGSLSGVTSDGVFHAIENAKLVLSDHIGSKVPKQLSVLPQVSSNANRKTLLVYVDNNGTPSRMSVDDITNSKIRTVQGVLPDDLQAGDYVFVEK